MMALALWLVLALARGHRAAAASATVVSGCGAPCRQATGTATSNVSQLVWHTNSTRSRESREPAGYEWHAVQDDRRGLARAAPMPMLAAGSDLAAALVIGALCALASTPVMHWASLLHAGLLEILDRLRPVTPAPAAPPKGASALLDRVGCWLGSRGFLRQHAATHGAATVGDPLSGACAAARERSTPAVET